MKRKLLALFVAASLVGNTFAQEETQQAVGTTIGGTADGVCRVSLAIKGGIDYLRVSDQKVQPEFGADIQFTINPLWGFGIEYMYIMNDRDAVGIYPSFDSHIHDATLFASFNLSNIIAKYRSSGWQKWNLYVNAGGGVSISSYNASTWNIEEDNKVRPVAIGGLALEWNAFEYVAFGLDVQYRWHTNTSFIGDLGDGRSIASANFSVRYKFCGANNTRSMALVDYDPVVNVSDGSAERALEAFEREYAARTARLENQIMDQNSAIQRLQARVKETQDSLKRHIDATRELERYIPTKEEEEIIKTAFSQLQFETGKDIIKPVSYSSLDGLATLLVQHPEWNVVLKGYTDSTGDYNRNLQLSRDRAGAVKTYLVNKGVKPSNIQSFGYGPADPVASNSTAAGRAQNRRVEIELYSK
jgi:outer membrane protein OmpA-like peptidoglycan-associated protein